MTARNGSLLRWRDSNGLDQALDIAIIA